MRVAFVTVGDPERRTGGHLYNGIVVSGLRGAGFEVRRLSPCGASPGEQDAAARDFGRSFGVSGFDVVVVDALARRVCGPHLGRWRRRRPVVALVHELPSVAGSAGPEEWRFERSLLLGADLFVAVSGAVRESLLRRGVPPGRVRVVPPGHDRLSPEKTPESGGPVQVLCVGQWIPRKGVLELVKAWRGLDPEGARLVLVGETGVDAGYAAAVRRAVNGDCSVRVAGEVSDEDLRRAYAGSDVFALLSRYEGYGMAYAEALAWGLPVVGCRVGPVPDLVGGAGVLVEPGDVDGAREALQALVRDADLRCRMSRVARQRARELPSWRDAVDGFVRVLREAAGGG
ncbi:D-inositol-3-phosphate glycosyltransferase [Rubrobacter xylanophilus DSM 9941]|uniref:glycosyltransferase family 4 protein n=1 Tax=Rubrobacter xylanophilus TaxID=49319 RepID=UPI001C63EF87|nr:glycosyltransferase family 4 protein [Rubrobacter xylanophilus]QYJ15632.1 D-inositol-3-phosphate glycosyltransferase [Rubrobacter xylanophilus DSM 9941]